MGWLGNETMDDGWLRFVAGVAKAGHSLSMVVLGFLMVTMLVLVYSWYSRDGSKKEWIMGGDDVGIADTNGRQVLLLYGSDRVTWSISGDSMGVCKQSTLRKLQSGI